MTAEDVRQAVLRMYRAAADATAIAALPAEIGARVTWSNGLTWQRAGEDAWEPVFMPDRDGWMPEESDIDAMRAPSLHIASGTIVTVEPAPEHFR